jgi:nucleoside-triphosphatase
MARTLLLTGRPGVGKTTVIIRLAKLVGERAGGFYTEEIRQQGTRQGFRLVELGGESGILAHVQYTERHYPRVGRYGVDVAALDRVGVLALERALDAGQVVIIDEIGKMELYSEAFKTTVLKAMAGDIPIVATALTAPHSWVDALKARPDVTLWQVTMENRDQMVARVIDWLKSEPGTQSSGDHADET